MLAKEFGWLPSEIKKEDLKDIEGIMVVMFNYNRVQNKEMEKASKKR